MNFKKGVLFTAIALLPVLACCLDLVFLIAELTIYKAMGLPQTLNLLQRLLHWTLICIAWGASAWGLLSLSKKCGFDMLAATKRPDKRQMVFLLFIITAGILLMSSSWEFRLKPLVELTNFSNTFGRNGVWAFLFQYLYYLFESMMILAMVALGQYAGEMFFPHPVMKRIPLGGIFCALTWGMLHGLSKDFNTALLCIVLSGLFGAAYLLSGRNLRYAYPVIALIFLI